MLEGYATYSSACLSRICKYCYGGEGEERVTRMTALARWLAADTGSGFGIVRKQMHKERIS